MGNLPSESWKRWKGEPSSYDDIEHISGCISRLGCRCAAYRDINPDPPAYLRGEHFVPGEEADD